MSLVHHVPDIAVVPCLGCGDPIAPENLFEHARHNWSSCCFWHPYHFWCIRTAPPAPCAFEYCAECAVPLPPATVEAMVAWAATFQRRVHRRTVTATKPTGQVADREDHVVSIPALGVRVVCVWWPPHADVSTKITPGQGVPVLAGESIDVRELLAERFELVHDACSDDDPKSFRAQLRAAPGDNALRAVYADYLEQAGDPRADFVRAVIQRSKMSGPAAKLLDVHLREQRQTLPSAWCRDVARAT